MSVTINGTTGITTPDLVSTNPITVGDAVAATDAVNLGQLQGGGILRTFISSLSRDMASASGTVSITGVGFTPKKVTFLAQVSTTLISSHGVSDGTGNICKYTQTNGDNRVNTAVCIAGVIATATQSATCTMTSDGFDLVWTKANSPTGTLVVAYIAEE